MKRILLCMALIFLLAPITAQAAQISLEGNIFGGGANTSDVSVTVNVYHNNGTFVDDYNNASFAELAWNHTYYAVSLDNLSLDTNYSIEVLASGPPGDPAAGNSTTNAVTPSTEYEAPTDCQVNVTLKYSTDMHSPQDGQGNTTEVFYNWTFPYADTPLEYTILLSETGNFASPDHTAVTNRTDHMLNISPLSPGNYDWTIEVRDFSKPRHLIHQSDVRTLTVGNGSVTISNITPTHGSWVNEPSVNLSFTTDDPALCRLNTDNNSDFSNKTPLWHTNGTEHWDIVYPTSQGENWYYLQCEHRDYGTISEEVDHMLRYDSIAPNSSSASITVENGSLYSLDTTLMVNWSGFIDEGSGISQYRVNLSDEGSTRNGIQIGARSVTLTEVPQGNQRVYVWGEDNAQNIGSAAESPLVIVDSLPPSFSDLDNTDIHNGTETTTDLVVEVTVTDSSPLNSTPTITYKKWDQDVTGPAPMENISGTIQSGKRFRYTIPAETGSESWQNNTGNYVRFNISATDMHGRTNLLAQEEYIEEELAPPSLDPIPDYTILQNETLTFNITAEDNTTGETLSYSCNLSDASLTKHTEETVRFTWSPTNEDVGEIRVRVNVTDGINTDTEEFTIEVINVNDPPQLPSSFKTSYTAYVGREFSLLVNASDPDGDTLSYSTNSSVFSISRYGDILTTPLYEDRGVHSLNLTISDGYTTVSESITITTEWCGDGICNNNFENKRNCSLDCSDDSQESSALIIHPRNCLNESMKIEAVRLVPRATCEEKGQIIDDMEVCGTLSDKEIRIEQVINDTYEVVAEIMTDENGVVTYTPPEEGIYRITLTSDSVTETFSTKECLGGEEKEEETSTKDETTEDSEINKTIEQPKQMPVQQEEASPLLRLLMYLAIPLLAITLTGLGAGYYYRVEAMKIGAGRKTKSSYVAFMDGYVKGPVKNVYTGVIDWLMGQEFIYYIVRKTATISARVKQKVTTTVKALYSEYMPKPKPRILDVPFLSMKDADRDNRAILMVVSANIFIHRWLTRKEVLQKIREGLSSVQKPYTLLRLGIASLNLRNTIAYNRVKKQDTADIRKAANAGIRVHNQVMDLKSLKKRISRKRAVIVTLKAKDPLNENKMVENSVIVNGYDKHNIVVHDFVNQSKNRRIKNEAFLLAWKNTGFEMLTIRKK